MTYTHEQEPEQDGWQTWGTAHGVVAVCEQGWKEGAGGEHGHKGPHGFDAITHPNTPEEFQVQLVPTHAGGGVVVAPVQLVGRPPFEGSPTKHPVFVEVPHDGGQ